MDKTEFVNAMRDSMYAAYLGGGRGQPRPLRPILARACIVVPIIARFTILIGTIYLGLAAIEYRWAVLLAVLAILWVNRGQLSRSLSFGTLLGSAQFMTIEQMSDAGYFGEEGLILGRARDMKPKRITAFIHLAIKPLAESEGLIRSFLRAMTGGRIDIVRVRDQPLVRLPKYIHTILVGPAGSGKNVSYVFPIILSYRHSMVILDPKNGENFKQTAEARKAMGFNIIRLDPFDEFGEGGHKLNILDLFQADDPMLMANARQLADALIPKSGKEKEGLHFLNLAQELLTALILFVVCHAPVDYRHLNQVRFFAADVTRLRACFAQMKKSSFVAGILAEMGSKLDSIYEREFSSVLSTLNQALAFLADPLVADHVSTSTFDIRATTRGTTTYLILPAKLMSPYAALMRLWLNAFILVKKDEGLGEADELMLMLDEVGNLGPIACLQEAVTVGRGLGIRCYFVLQALQQIEANFPPPQSDTIIAGCDLKIFIGVNDLTTAKIVSEMAGTATVTVPSHQAGQSHSGGGPNGSMSFGSNRGQSYAPQTRKILMEDEVLRSPGTGYIFVSGQPPMVVSPIKHYEDRIFSHLNDSSLLPTPSPYSWAIAALGLYSTLPLAWSYVHTPTRTTVVQSPQLSLPSSESPTSDGGNVTPSVLGGLDRSPTIPTMPPSPPRPVEAICPRCKGRFDLPEGYDGRPLQCPDCPTIFRVFNR